MTRAGWEGCVDSDVDGRQATLLYFNNHQGCFTRQVTCRNSWKSFVSTIFKWKGMAFTLPWDKDLELFPPPFPQDGPYCRSCYLSPQLTYDDSQTKRTKKVGITGKYGTVSRWRPKHSVYGTSFDCIGLALRRIPQKTGEKDGGIAAR